MNNTKYLQLYLIRQDNHRKSLINSCKILLCTNLELKNISSHLVESQDLGTCTVYRLNASNMFCMNYSLEQNIPQSLN